MLEREVTQRRHDAKAVAVPAGRTLLDMNAYQWTVLFAAWLGWGFDIFDSLLFNYVAPNAVPGPGLAADDDLDITFRITEGAPIVVYVGDNNDCGNHKCVADETGTIGFPAASTQLATLRTAVLPGHACVTKRNRPLRSDSVGTVASWLVSCVRRMPS